MVVMIGVDPHKQGSHTAVAIDGNEVELASVTVRATRRQVDSNDARSVAIAALWAPRLTRVGRSDHSGVLRLYAKRTSDLGRARNRTACRLHALLAELVAGGIPKEINAAQRAAAARVGHARIAGGAGPARVGVRAPRGPASLRRADARLEEVSRGGGQRVGHHAHRLRRVHRHVTDRDELRWTCRASPVATREPATEPRDPHRCDHPDPLRALTGACVLRPKSRGGQDETRSGARTQASNQRRDLPPTAPRRREHGPGRANGDDS
jgi:hypothetical protein